MMIHPSQVDQGSKTTYAVQNDEDLDDILARTNEQSRPIERIVNVVTAYFVPVVTALAILTWVIWLSLGLSGILPSNTLANTVGGWRTTLGEITI